MSAAKVAVFILKLISFGGIIFSFSVAAAAFLMPIPPAEMLGGSAMEIPPGCFMMVLLIFLVPLSLIPAFAAWMIQQRMVLPREAAERSWRDAASAREERLWVWTSYATHLLLRNRGVAGTVPLLQPDLPRAFGELDHGRRKRLLFFLREVGLEDAIPRNHTWMETRTTEEEPTQTLPSRSLVKAVAVVLSLASAFLALWIGLGTINILTTDAHKVMQETLGIKVDRMQFLVPIPGCLIAALLPGLAAAGLLRMHRRAARSLEQRGGNRAVIQDRALQGAIESLGTISQITRAAALIAIPELDGSRRGTLIQALFDSGWLTGDTRISLEGVDLKGAELAGASLPGAGLSGTDLSGADLSGADLGKAELSRANLRESDLRSCRLAGVALRGADLRGARLQKAELERADLREVLLDGANFWGASLSGADLMGARGTAELLNLKAETV